MNRDKLIKALQWAVIAFMVLLLVTSYVSVLTTDRYDSPLYGSVVVSYKDDEIQGQQTVFNVKTIKHNTLTNTLTITYIETTPGDDGEWVYIKHTIKVHEEDIINVALYGAESSSWTLFPWEVN